MHGRALWWSTLHFDTLMWRPSLITYLYKATCWMIFFLSLIHQRCGTKRLSAWWHSASYINRTWGDELLISINNYICLSFAFRLSLSWFPTVKLELTFCHQLMTSRHCWMIRLLKHRLWEVHLSSNHLRQRSSMLIYIFVVVSRLPRSKVFFFHWVRSKLCWFFPWSNVFFWM